MVCGIAPLTAVTVYSLAGFSGLGGRLLLGVLADRFGAKHVLVGGLFVLEAVSVVVQVLSTSLMSGVKGFVSFFRVARRDGRCYRRERPANKE